MPALLLALVLAQGCAARGLSIDDLVDDTLTTGSVPAAATASDQPLTSDRTTMMNAVSAAIVDEMSSDGLGWANAQTGSRGLISAIAEERSTGSVCRRFMSSRESFAGVHLYRGTTCLASGGRWAMMDFSEVR